MAYTFGAMNPYPTYPMNGYQPYAQPQYAQQNQQNVQQQSPAGLIWVDGEVGAKAYQLPSGWPSNTPLPLWDTNDTVIYLKSVNQMGMPNPLQKIHYKMDEMQTQPAQTSLAALPAASEHTEYVTKDDLERMKEEIRASISEIANTQASAKKGGRGNESAV